MWFHTNENNNTIPCKKTFNVCVFVSTKEILIFYPWTFNKKGLKFKNGQIREVSAGNGKLNVISERK